MGMDLNKDGWVPVKGDGTLPRGFMVGDKVNWLLASEASGANTYSDSSTTLNERLVQCRDGYTCVAIRHVDWATRPTPAGDSDQATTFMPLPVLDTMTDRAPLVAQTQELPSGGERISLTGEPGLAINPKDAIGATKVPVHLWPAEATALGSLGMLEGMLKYGQNNFIAGDGVIASIYVDAAMRHLMAWFAGEDAAHDTGTPHLGNALATIAILVKARAHGKLIDDRDYSPAANGALYRAFIENEVTPHIKRLKEMFKDKSPKHFTIADIAEAA